MIKRITLSLFLITLVLCAKSQADYTKSDSLIFEKYCGVFKDKKNLSLSELVKSTALFFLNKPYVASTLEKNGSNEKLVVNLREFDCTTFVETCIALSQTIKSSDLSFQNYRNNLMNLRYRSGVIDGYSSRLHYSSDWIYENEKRNIFENIGQSVGGYNINKDINFMSTHPQSYFQLKNNTEEIKKIKNIENQLNKRGGFFVINKEKITTIEKDVKDGDIILFSTQINGLDFTHMGIAYKSDDHMSFIHASSSAKKVIIEKHSLYRYCQNSKNCNGIVVLRMNNTK